MVMRRCVVTIRTVPSVKSDNPDKQKGPKLQITTPEEEWDIFQDIVAVPQNELLQPLLLEERHISKATKDNKAPIKPEMWDKFLYLGLHKEIGSRDWAVVARTICPLIARHWRQVQLRKWIRFGKDKIT
jgi:hypothetical protein